MVTYISCVALEDSKPFATFKDALEDFISRMKRLVKPGTSRMVLETACWIQRKDPENGSGVLYFYNVKDLGFRVGLLENNSQLVKNAKEPDPILLSRIFYSMSPEKIIASIPVKVS